MTNYDVILIILALAAITVSTICNKPKKPKRLSGLARFAFVFVVAGIFFSGDGFIGFPLLGLGVLLAFVDVTRNLENR